MIIGVVESMLIKAGISNKVDDTAVTVGKRYARTDECGIPFAITVDHDTLEDETVTLRDKEIQGQGNYQNFVSHR